MDQQIIEEPSHNDTQVLERKRDVILGVVFLILSIFPLLEIPVLFARPTYSIDYFNDLFNLAIALIMLPIVIMLFKHKPVLKWFLYVVLAGSAGSIVFWALDHNWLLVTAEVALAAYVIYYVKTSLTRRVHRKANYILLPLSIAMGLLGGFASAQNQAQVQNEIINPASAFNLANLEVQQAYLALIGEQDPALLDQKFEALKIANNKKLVEIGNIESKAAAELKLTDDTFKEYNEAVISNMEAHKAQSMKTKKLVEFNESIDNLNATEEQVAQNLKYIQEITALETAIRQTGAELQKFLR